MRTIHPNHTNEQLCGLAQAGDRDAANDLILRVRLLICNIANGILEQSIGFDFDDLLQEGLLACVDAIRWFDESRGFRFTTYAADAARRRIWKHTKERKNKALPQEGETGPDAERSLNLIPDRHSAGFDEREDMPRPESLGLLASLTRTALNRS